MNDIVYLTDGRRLYSTVEPNEYKVGDVIELGGGYGLEIVSYIGESECIRLYMCKEAIYGYDYRFYDYMIYNYEELRIRDLIGLDFVSGSGLVIKIEGVG